MKAKDLSTSDVLGLVEDNTFILNLEPLHGIILCHSMLNPNASLAPTATSHTVSRAFKNHVEVHPIDTSRRIVLDSKINVLLDTESEAASVTEVPPQELVLLHFQATLKKLHCLVSSHGDIARNLFITPDSERSHSVPRLGEDRGLPTELFKHLGGTSETITTLTDGDVKDELLDLNIPHGVRELLLRRHLRIWD